MKGVICAPVAPTCGDRVLDYFVVSERIHHAVKHVFNVGDTLCTPHSPTRILISVDARVMMVRQLKVPMGFGARLPHGPVADVPCFPTALVDATSDEAKVDDSDHRSLSVLGTDHAGMIARMEDELTSIEGISGKDAEKRKGRAGGPKYVWKHVAGEAGDSSQNTTSVSRAWRRTATWLTTIMNTKSEPTAQVARWKVLNYAHPSPDNARASKEQLEAMKEFARWKQAVDPRQLYSTHWLTMLRLMRLLDGCERLAIASRVDFGTTATAAGRRIAGGVRTIPSSARRSAKVRVHDADTDRLPERDRFGAIATGGSSDTVYSRIDNPA